MKFYSNRLSLRTFISPTPNHMNLGQQALTNVASLVAAQHQSPHQQLTQQNQVANRHHQNSPIQATAHSSHTLQSQTTNNHHSIQTHANQSQLSGISLNVGCVPLRQTTVGNMSMVPVQKVCFFLFYFSFLLNF